MPLRSLLTYLNKIQIWYQIWNDHEDYISLSLDTRFTLLKVVADYFEPLSKLRNIVALRRAPQQLEFVKRLWTKYKWDPDSNGVWRLGHFGTNINENFFGQMRAKNVCYSRSFGFILFSTFSLTTL